MRDLISKDTTVREAVQTKIRALPPEAQLQLMGYAAQKKEKTPPSLFRRLCTCITSTKTSSSDLTYFILRYGIMKAIVDDVTDPRFITPLLDFLVNMSGLRGMDLDFISGRPTWGSGMVPLPPFQIQPSAILRKHNLPLRTKVFRALQRTLGNRQAADTFSLTPGRKQALLLPLNAPYRDVELTELVLDVLKQIGDTESIPLLERIIAVEAVTGNMQRVQQAAQECVSAWRLRAERGRQAQTLLRAADSGTPEELLRPVAQADQTPPEELLHVEERT
jgi:hypothetical protein